MSEPSTDFNPFQAPVADAAEKQELGEDDEFLVSRREILCRDTVILPLVCIRYGETEDLEQRKKLLRMLSGTGAFSLVLTVIGFLLLVGATIGGQLPFSGSSSGKLFYLTVFIMALPATFWAFRRYGCRMVDASWYVGPRYRRMILWEKRIGRAIVFFVTAAGGVGIARESGSWWPLVGLAGLGLLLSIFFDPNINLQLVGRRRGVFLLRGHSKSFYLQVQRNNSRF
ncbi:MAG: hypothetical protein P8J37_02040 [Fuerstiella sp.]|nr:hypothetical protein [Fuerstiella sp.]